MPVSNIRAAWAVLYAYEAKCGTHFKIFPKKIQTGTGNFK
jgi:hypothetical protein